MTRPALPAAGSDPSADALAPAAPAHRLPPSRALLLHGGPVDMRDAETWRPVGYERVPRGGR